MAQETSTIEGQLPALRRYGALLLGSKQAADDRIEVILNHLPPSGWRQLAADRTLFGLSHGIYPTREAGEAALEQLHQRHAHRSGWQTPWLRSTDDLKVLIRKVIQTTSSKNG